MDLSMKLLELGERGNHNTAMEKAVIKKLEEIGKDAKECSIAVLWIKKNSAMQTTIVATRGVMTRHGELAMLLVVLPVAVNKIATSRCRFPPVSTGGTVFRVNDKIEMRKNFLLLRR
jgi:hypothetical protein